MLLRVGVRRFQKKQPAVFDTETRKAATIKQRKYTYLELTVNIIPYFIIYVKYRAEFLKIASAHARRARRLFFALKRKSII